jgi:hypothetical protein
MRNLIFALIGLTSAFASLKGQNPPPSESPAALTPGRYVLIDGNLDKTVITFSKGSDGRLALACPTAPASPSAVFQKGPVFQFSLLYPDPDRSTVLRCSTYVGRGVTASGGDVNYTGSFAYLVASQSKGVSQSTGKFILYKVGDKP